jgi:alanyl-tRNA synthetase
VNRSLRDSLLEYHRMRNFVLYESFPLVTDDQSVLFTNATITPFKHFFENRNIVPHDYALIQQCLRVGGGAGGLETARHDPNYSSLFEMFGCGLFNRTYPVAAKYFLEMLQHVGLPKRNLRFVVPGKSIFADSLLENGIESSSIFTINENGDFWQDWRFGKDGLVGRGLTAVFARENIRVRSIDEMVGEPLSFVEIGNLIHIYGKAEGAEIVPVAHEGFDVGIGMARFSIALEGKTLYELSPFWQLVEIVTKCLGTLGVGNMTQGTTRVIVSHLRSVVALIQEGVIPGNKRHAFVLRKLIRSLLEVVWLSVGRIVPSEGTISAFAESVAPEHLALLVKIVGEEERVFREALERGKLFLVKNPSAPEETLRDTYGIRRSLLSLKVGE